jgi:hypothetical protein
MHKRYSDARTSPPDRGLAVVLIRKSRVTKELQPASQG